jgi:RHS repeat-associated protein
MSLGGKPAARMGDATLKGGPIIKGSLTVLIGSQGGVACAPCPGGKTVGSPVNPSLGAKVLDGGGELDITFPGALSFSWQRQYSSYVNLKEGARCGLHGYGWGSPLDLEIEHASGEVKLHDSRGRTITFDEPLAPGEALYSASEDIWIARGGRAVAAASNETHWSNTARFAALDRRWVAHPQLIFAASGTPDGPVWCFASQAMSGGAADPMATRHIGRVESYDDLRAQTDALGRCLLYRVVDRYGRSQQLARNDKAELTGITDALGRTIEFVFSELYAPKAAVGPWLADGGRRLSAIVLKSAVSHQGLAPIRPSALGLDEEGRIVLARYHYSAEGDLIQVDRREGAGARRFAYVNHLMIAHAYKGELIEASVEAGADSAGDSLNALDIALARASAYPHHYRYDRYEPGGFVTKQHNRDGLNYRFDYRDEQDRALRASSKRHASTVVTDNLGRAETYRFEGEAGLKRIVEHIRADGSRAQMSYDSAGRRTGETDPLGRQTYYRLDPSGRLIGTQGPDGNTVSFAYDGEGRLMSRSLTGGGEGVDAQPLAVTYEHDEFGRLTETKLDGVVVERRRYSDLIGKDGARQLAERPSELVDAKGGVKRMQWDIAGQLLAYTDCSERTTRYQYTAYGEIARITDADDRSVNYEFDLFGRLYTTRYPDGSFEQFHYDAADALIAVIPHAASGARAGESVSVERDRVGRVVSRAHAGTRLAYSYDVADRLLSLTNENNAQTRFRYDPMDRLIEEIGFDGRTQRYGYNAGGELIHATDGSAAAVEREQRFAYDRAGRLIERSITDVATGHCIEHAYGHNATGLITEASAMVNTRPDSKASWQRDRLGRVAAETQTLFNVDPASKPGEIEFEHTLTHRFDPLGNRIESDLPAELGVLAYQHYGSGHLHGVLLNQTSLIDFERDRVHREVERALHLDGHTAYISDADPVSTASATKPAIISRRFDPLGRLAAQEAPSLPELDRRYQYNALGQLTEVLAGGAHDRTREHSGTHTQYRYDPIGRLVAAQLSAIEGAAAGANAGAGAGANVLAAFGYRFDAAGNRLSATETGALVDDRDASSRRARAADGANLASWRNSANESADQTAALVRQSQFNALEGDPKARATRKGDPVAFFKDNRISEHVVNDSLSSYRYDAFGNRIEAIDAEGNTTRYRYDLLHRLIAVERNDAHGSTQGTQSTHSTETLATYRYDAMGRRLCKAVPGTTANRVNTSSKDSANTNSNSPSNSRAARRSTPTMQNLHAVDRPSPQDSALSRKAHRERVDLDSETVSGSSQTPPLAPIKQFVTHYGWDGDRLVHTETEHAIEHTLYEPDSFVPLLKLSKRKGEPSLSQMMFGDEGGKNISAALPRAQQRMIDVMMNQIAKDPSIARDALARMQGIERMQQQQIAAVTNIKPAQDESVSSARGEPVEPRVTGEDNTSPLYHLNTLLAQHAQAKKDFPVTVHHIHCDHLGTPIAVIAANGEHAGQVVWSALYDPWGNLLQEHHIDPKNPIAQTIRFQGQHFDSESGLHYNRHRYYDPAIGGYISQDPLGLEGGAINLSEYAFNSPTVAFDPTGTIVPLVVLGAWAAKAAIGAAIGAGVEIGMQVGKQTVGQIRDNWDSDRGLMKNLTDVDADCIDVNWKHVGVSAAIGTVAPGMFSTGKTVYTSGQALKTLSGQAANTANRAAKLAARKEAHKQTIKNAVGTQAAWQGAKAVTKCVVGGGEDKCPE